jgi:hypothetical protein
MSQSINKKTNKTDVIGRLRVGVDEGRSIHFFKGNNLICVLQMSRVVD